MKNIRSKSIAALSIVLLLSTPAVQSMNWNWVSSAKGAISSAASSVASKWAARPSLPTLAEAKEMVSNQATALYETAKEHPVITAAIAAPVAVVAGYGVYKAGQKVKRNKTTKALMAEIKAEVLNDLTTIQITIVDKNLNGTAKVVGSCQLAQNLLPLIDQLPASQQALKVALQKYGAAAVAWDNASSYSADSLQEVNSAVEALNKFGFNFGEQTEVAQPVTSKLSALVPSKRAVINTAKHASMLAIPVIAYGYFNGYFDGAINAGSNVVNNVINTVSDVDYAGRLAQAQARVAPVTNFAQANVITPATGFVKAHPYAVGGATAGLGLGTTLFLNRDAIKKAAQTRKAVATREAKLIAELKAVQAAK